MSIEYTEFKQTVMEIRLAINDLNKELSKMLTSCPHEEIEEKSSYSPGSYYDTASTDYWNECKLCGERSEITTVNHGNYG